MGQALGKVTFDLNAPRGPDAKLEITVGPEHFGQSIEVEIPRNLSCAACHGGGCDRCERSGALSVRGRGEPGHSIDVSLPTLTEQQVQLRIPGEGGFAEDESLPRGHLLLLVKKGAEVSPCVQIVPIETTLSRTEERELMMKRSLVMAAVLIALFFGMLRLSGWL